jgi:hypothetical protein
MLYFAKFKDDAVTPVVVGAATAELAAARVLEEVGESPVVLHELPDEMLLCEVHFAGGSRTEEGDVDDGNPANVVDVGVALEPFDLFAAWLDQADAAELGTAPTEPAPAGQR